MDKKTNLYRDIKAVCNSTTKKLMALGLELAAVCALLPASQSVVTVAQSTPDYNSKAWSLFGALFDIKEKHNMRAYDFVECLLRERDREVVLAADSVRQKFNLDHREFRKFIKTHFMNMFFAT